MKEFIKKNFAILLAFILPVLLILGIAISTYLPSLSVKTNYNFIYASCTDGTNYYYNCNNYLVNRYAVVNNRITLNTIDPVLDSNNNNIPDIQEKYTARIFLYNTKTNENKEITFEEATRLNLSSLLTSPDGVTVSNNYSYDSGCGEFFIFGGGCRSSGYGYNLTKGHSHRKITLINTTDRYYYENNFQFLGWVLQ